MPGVAQLKAILPILSMICSFIVGQRSPHTELLAYRRCQVWSWTTLKNDDKGDGIILAATWILPVAIIPRTLDRTKWPAPTATPPTTSAPVAAPAILAAFERPADVPMFVFSELLESNCVAQGDSEEARPQVASASLKEAVVPEEPHAVVETRAVSVDPIEADGTKGSAEQAPVKLEKGHGVGHLFQFKKWGQPVAK